MSLLVAPVPVTVNQGECCFPPLGHVDRGLVYGAVVEADVAATSLEDGVLIALDGEVVHRSRLGLDHLDGGDGDLLVHHLAWLRVVGV